MKALSLWQPWASAIACGSKTVETRSWSTKYRGPLAIHAAKRFRIGEMIHTLAHWNWTGALDPLLQHQERLCGPGNEHINDTLARFPLGSIVATCYLQDIVPTDSMTVGFLDKKRYPGAKTFPANSSYAWTERQMGDFTPGRFAWILTEIKPITPIPFKGRQGLFNVPDDLFEPSP